jgi:hypothetical protein
MGAEGNRSTAVNLHGSDAFEQRRAWAFSTIEAGAKERWWTRNKLELGDGDELRRWLAKGCSQTSLPGSIFRHCDEDHGPTERAIVKRAAGTEHRAGR